MDGEADDREMVAPLDGEGGALALAERLTLAARATGQGLWEWDCVRRTSWWNETYDELLGPRPLESRSGFGWWLDRVHPDDRARVVASFRAALRGPAATWTEEYRLRRADGSHAIVLDRAAIARAPDGRASRVVGAVVEVTERRRSEEALRESEQRLRALAETDRRRTEFLAVLSHELRNPLAPIRNAVHILGRAAPDGAQARRAREVIRRQADQLARLVDDLLDVTRLARDQVALQRARIDAGELVGRTAEDHRALLEAHGVDLRVDLPDAEVWVDADAARLSQVLGNLLHNAAKFTPARGTVTVELARDRTRAVIRVRDDGIGMEPDEVARMFEPFVQAERSLARAHGGLGLGLAVVKSLVELHGGTVEARSEGPGRGSEFAVALPVAEPPAADARAPREARRRRGRVVVVEDGPDAAEMLAEVLALEGWEVHVACDGRTGLALVRDVRPDVVLCDIGLPDVNGYDVARALRADASLRGIRLVALSGYAQREDLERALAAGFDAHLAKPARLEALEAALEGAPRPRRRR